MTTRTKHNGWGLAQTTSLPEEPAGDGHFGLPLTMALSDIEEGRFQEAMVSLVLDSREVILNLAWQVERELEDPDEFEAELSAKIAEYFGLDPDHMHDYLEELKRKVNS